MSFVAYCTEFRLPGRPCLSTTTAGNLSPSLGFCVSTRRDPSVPVSAPLSAESLKHLKSCICFTGTGRNPFSSSAVFAQSLTCVFFFLVNLRIYLHRELTNKVLFWRRKQSLLMLISFSSKNLAEGEVRGDCKKFLSSFY